MPVENAFAAAIGSARGVNAANRLCRACVDLLSVDAAALSLVFDGANVGTVGVSSEEARTLDELQFVLGEGPCLESVSIRAPIFVLDLDDREDSAHARWPAYGPAMLARHIRSVFAMPVLVAGEYLGALDLFCQEPGSLGADDLVGALAAAEIAELPLLDVLGGELQVAAANPDSSAWNELTTISRAEVSQATGMLVAQLDIEPAEALVRLRAHAYAEGRSATEVARDILERRLRLDAD